MLKTVSVIQHGIDDPERYSGNQSIRNPSREPLFAEKAFS
jgi:hypothetical protein